MASVLRKNSIAAGIISGIILSAVTAVIIGFSGQTTGAAAYIACDGASRPILRYGDRGSCVSKAQQLLAANDVLSATPNGVFGPATKEATLTLQTQRGLAADGIIGPNTWQALDGSSTVQTSQPTQPVAGVVPDVCRTSDKTICVVKGSRSQAVLYAIEDGSVIRQMDARTGDGRGSSYATGEGTFTVYWKHIDHVSSIYDAAMPYSLFFNGGEAIHFSDDFVSTGYDNSSHGCVNLRDRAAAAWLYRWSPKGTRVIVVRG